MFKYNRKQVVKYVTKGKNLEGEDLSNMDLSKVDFRSKELGGQCEGFAKLSGVNLRGSDLSNANLSGADLRHADLRDTDLRNTKLEETDLFNANFDGATLTKANLREAILSGASLRKTNLNNAELFRADLSCAKLIEAKLNRANLSCADLSNANLRNADLTYANLENSILSKANFSGVNIYRANAYKWKIEGIQCTHVFQCPNYETFSKPAKREKCRRNFKTGEFEILYQSLLKIELIFQQRFSFNDTKNLLSIIEKINQKLLSPLDFVDFKNGINTSVTLTGKRDTIKQAPILICKIYLAKEEAFYVLQERVSAKLVKEENLSENDEQFLLMQKIREKTEFTRPEIYREEDLFNLYSLSRKDEGRKIAYIILEQLNSAKDLKFKFNQIDKDISSGWGDSEEKQIWLRDALKKLKDFGKMDFLSDDIPPILEEDTGNVLFEVFRYLYNIKLEDDEEDKDDEDKKTSPSPTENKTLKKI